MSHRISWTTASKRDKTYKTEIIYKHPKFVGMKPVKEETGDVPPRGFGSFEMWTAATST